MISTGTQFFLDFKPKLEVKSSSGTFTTQDFSYSGQFKRNNRHGNGLCRWNDGRVYDGEWKNDKMNGRGKLRLANGVLYD